MTWAELAPVVRQKSFSNDAIVTISVSRPSRFIQRVFLTVRPKLLPKGNLHWWTYGRPVNVEIGQGEHAGRLRLTDRGSFQIMRQTGRRAKDKPNAPILQIAAIPDMPVDGLGRQNVDWEIVSDALIVTLPWSGAKGAVKLAPLEPRAVGAPSHALPVPRSQPAASATAVRHPKTAPALAQVATHAEVLAWAIANGVGSQAAGFDLPTVNSFRFGRGERPFAISNPMQRGQK